MSKVLIIDNDRLVRDAMEIFLARAGHKTITAADGSDGLQAYIRNQPDLVVLNIDLPILSGAELLFKIHALSAATPVIMLSASEVPEHAADYLRSGAAAVLSKKDGLLSTLNEIDRLLGTVKNAPPPAPLRRPAAAAPAGKSKGLVLVVDDDAPMAEVLSRFLTSYGYEVLKAEDGESALELARARRPAVVVLDIAMPRVDGVDVLRELVPELPCTGFIMLSGNEDEDVARACMKIGAFDFLSKPANLTELETLVRTCMAANKA
jgi:DNA-binding response OmpR family regulator